MAEFLTVNQETRVRFPAPPQKEMALWPSFKRCTYGERCIKPPAPKINGPLPSSGYRAILLSLLDLGSIPRRSSFCNPCWISNYYKIIANKQQGLQHIYGYEGSGDYTNGLLNRVFEGLIPSVSSKVSDHPQGTCGSQRISPASSRAMFVINLLFLLSTRHQHSGRRWCGIQQNASRR